MCVTLLSLNLLSPFSKKQQIKFLTIFLQNDHSPHYDNYLHVTASAKSSFLSSDTDSAILRSKVLSFTC